MYIWSFDISLSNTGVSILDLGGNPICVFSIPTSPKDSHPQRLKYISNILTEMRKQYSCDLMLYESGFSRYALSTQAIYESIGVIMCCFYDCPQISFAPSTVRKTICDNGRADKEMVKQVVLKQYPHLKLANYDESDSLGVALCYLKKEGVVQLK